MSQCPATAVLIITREIEGTATNVAKTRLDLRCTLDEGHAGQHYDAEHGERWEGGIEHRRTLIRHETE